MNPFFCSLHILFTVRFTFNILDHSIDIGQVFGAIGGMLFSGSGDKNNNNTNENIPEGELKLSNRIILGKNRQFFICHNIYLL